MAEKTQKCGAKTIRYPGECTYSCVCPGGSGPCTWTVTCGNGPPISGTGLTVSQGENGGHPKGPQVTLDGKLSVVSQMLQETWKRRVIVPANLRNRTIRKRTLKGTPEQIADALGLRLGGKVSKAKTKTKMIFIK